LLRKALDQLVASGLIFRQGNPPEAVYSFKHSLVRDVAYESLLRGRRSAFHADVVAALLKEIPDFGETNPGVLGYHCAKAGLIEQAASYYRFAGEKSAERAAMTEMRKQLERGLALAHIMPDGAPRRILEIELKLALGRVLLSTKGSADVDAGRVFEEAVVLCRNLDHDELMTRALWGYWFNSAHRRELTDAEHAAQELLCLGGQQSQVSAQAVAHAMLGITHLWQGRFEEAMSNLRAAYELCRSTEYKRLDLAIVANNLDYHVNVLLSLTLACLGYLKAAAGEAQHALVRAKRLDHLPSRAIILAIKSRHDWLVRDYAAARETATALLELSEKQGFPFYIALGRCHLGWLAAKEGRIDEGIELMRTGLAALQSTDAVIWQAFYWAMMAEVQAWAGHFNEADALIAEALSISSQTGSRWFDAELHRLKGEILLCRSSPDEAEAEACFGSAMAIAQQQSAKLWELRAATNLARLWSQQDKRAQARDLLAPVHDWFADAPDNLDVKEAAALLTELAD
jgi:predicted ATPase